MHNVYQIFSEAPVKKHSHGNSMGRLTTGGVVGIVIGCIIFLLLLCCCYRCLAGGAGEDATDIEAGDAAAAAAAGGGGASSEYYSVAGDSGSLEFTGGAVAAAQGGSGLGFGGNAAGPAANSNRNSRNSKWADTKDMFGGEWI